MPADRRVNGAARGYHAVYDGLVFTLDRALLQRFNEVLVRPEAARDHHQPGRILVQPVHNAGPRDAAEPGVEVQQRVDQRAVCVPGRGVNHQARGLVQHDNVFILVHDVQRHRLRSNLATLVVRLKIQLQRFIARKPCPGLYRGTIQQDPAVTDPLLQSAARVFREHARQCCVQPLSRELLGYLLDDRRFGPGLWHSVLKNELGYNAAF